MSEIKAALYIGFALGTAFGITPSYFIMQDNIRQIATLEATNAINAERLRTLEDFLAGYKEASLTNRR